MRETCLQYQDMAEEAEAAAAPSEPEPPTEAEPPKEARIWSISESKPQESDGLSELSFTVSLEDCRVHVKVSSGGFNVGSDERTGGHDGGRVDLKPFGS